MANRTVEEEVQFRELGLASSHTIFPTDILNELRRLERLASYIGNLPNIRGGQEVAELIRQGLYLTQDPLTQPVNTGRVSVRVSRDDDTLVWTISVRVNNTGQELPTCALIKSLLPPEHKHFIPSRVPRYTSSLSILRRALDQGLSATALHDALKAWAISKIEQPTSASSDTDVDAQQTDALLKTQAATLEVAGRIYKLVPCGVVDTRPLITRVRKKALATVKVEAEGIKTRAATDARLVVTQAEDKANRLRAEAQAVLDRAGAKAPDWVINSRRPHRFNGSSWQVELRVSTQLTEVRHTVRDWDNTVLYWNAIPLPRVARTIPIWLNLSRDGSYTRESITCGEWKCMHIGSYMCMELQATPLSIKGNNDLLLLEKAISRGMQVMNLNSPLEKAYKYYHPDIVEQIPLTIKKWLDNQVSFAPIYVAQDGNPGHDRLETPTEFQRRTSIKWDRIETSSDELAGTFDAHKVANLIRTAAEVVTGFNRAALVIDSSTAATEMLPIPATTRRDENA